MKKKKGFCAPSRYLVPFDTDTAPAGSTEIAVVGSGVAGLQAALTLAEKYSVSVITKEEIRDSNTGWAQGGIAAVLAPEDSFEGHINDTLQAGAGLCDRPTVEKLVRRGSEVVVELADEWDLFDRVDGELAFSREGGHSRSRVVHAGGDATGSELEELLVRRVEEHPRITVYEHTLLFDLLTADNRCSGLLVKSRDKIKILWTGAVILATGGAGELFRETTNASVITGDGMAAAFRAGVALRDMEFIQFHPTVLYLAGAPRFLITEALRGEGGLLKDLNGKRFMDDAHSMAELAPRDIVSRSILERMIATDTPFVHLDVTHLSREILEKRFPTVSRVCGEYGIDIAEEPIPVRPCAHYCMGGIKSNLNGETSLENLYAVGETASTGVHGANRLASNSLLEGLVAGRLVGQKLLNETVKVIKTNQKSEGFEDKPRLNLQDLRHSLQSLLWREAGILRRESKLQKARYQLDDWLKLIRDYPASNRAEMELINMMQLGRLLLEAALKRQESRGAHYRTDYPEAKEKFRSHTVINRENNKAKIRYEKIS